MHKTITTSVIEKEEEFKTLEIELTSSKTVLNLNGKFLYTCDLLSIKLHEHSIEVEVLNDGKYEKYLLDRFTDKFSISCLIENKD